MRRLATSLLIVLATAGLAACSSSATTSPASSSAANPSVAVGSPAGSSGAGPSVATGAACATAPAGGAAAATVTIKNFAFAPSPVQASVGDVIAWKNDDSAPHSATMDDESCDTDTIAAGSTAMLVFTAAGTYTYHCKIHPGQMKDVTVEVK